MAIQWGAPLKASNGWQVRTGYEVVATSSTATTYTITRRQYMQSLWPLDDLVDVGASGPGVASINVPDVPFSSMSSNGSWSSAPIRQIRGNWSQTFTRQYGAAQSLPFTLTVSGIYGFAGTATVSGTVTVPARPYSVPAAPSGVGVTRSSDGRHVINWTRNSPSSPSAPYQNVVTQRWDNVSNAYQTIATVGNVSSYTDNGTRSGRRYRWRVAAKNSGGTSAWAYSDYVYTTPAAPAYLTAARQGADVMLTWPASASPVTGYEIARRPGAGGGAWEYPGWTTTGTSFLVRSPDPSTPWTYAVQAKAGTLASVYVWSNEVQLLTAPKAPSALAPAVAEAGLPVALTWTHNTADTSGQAAYSIRWRAAGSTTWPTTPQVAKTTSSTSTHTLTADTWDAGAWEWQVQTWGAHADPSPWSTTRTTNVSERPSVTVTEPAEGAFPGSRVTARWAFYDPEGGTQGGYRVALYSADGDALWSRVVTSTATSVDVAYTLQDGMDYVLGVAAKDALGLWSAEVAVPLSVQYAPPPTASVTAEWNATTGAAAVTIAHPAPGEGEVPAVSCELWRATDYAGEPAEWVLIASGLDLETTIVDPTPALGTASRYRVTTISATPSTVDSVEATLLAPSGGWTFLNGGPGDLDLVRVRGNTSFASSFERTTHHMQTANSDGYPITVFEDTFEDVVKVSARLAPTVGGGSTWHEIRSFVKRSPGPVLYRDPMGNRWRATITGLTAAAKNDVVTCSFTVTRVSDHEIGGEVL